MKDMYKIALAVLSVLIAVTLVLVAHAETKTIVNGEYIICEIDTKEDAVEIYEAPPINRISDALDEVDAEGHQLEYIGEFKLTYYCACRKCNGGPGIDRYGDPLVWGTVAVDPNVIPLQTQLVIDGYDAVFTARDTGGKWVRGNHIDVFVPVSHSEALKMPHGEHRKVWIRR